MYVLAAHVGSFLHSFRRAGVGVVPFSSADDFTLRLSAVFTWYFIHHGRFQMHHCSKTYAQAHWPGDCTCPDCRDSVETPLQIGTWWANSKKKSGNILWRPCVGSFRASVRWSTTDTSGPTQNTPANACTLFWNQQARAPRPV